MLKIVKSRVYNFDSTKPVSLGIADEPEAPEITQEEPEAPVITPEEEEKLRELEQRRLEEENARRFNEAVLRRSDEVILARKAELDREYSELLSAGRLESERLISEAKTKTKAVLDAAEEEGKKLREQAERSGYEAGFEAGRQEAREKCEKYLEAAATLLSEINSKKEAYYIANEYELCNTVMDMVRKITLAEIKTDPSVIDRIAANAAKNFRNSDYLKISVCRGEASKELVTDREFLKSMIPFIPEVEIEELDPEDAPEGTIVLDNGSEIIDASIPTQLDFLREIMKNSRGEDADEE